MTEIIRFTGLQIPVYKRSDCKSDPAVVHMFSVNPEERGIYLRKAHSCCCYAVGMIINVEPLNQKL
mgnify:CR=1 FL=1